MDVHLWGVRGSLPAPAAPDTVEKKIKYAIGNFLSAGNLHSNQIDSFVKTLPPHLSSGFGGNTACIQVSSGTQNLIIDAGSGIRSLGEKLMGGACGEGKGKVHILMTHFHWDHIIGLAFFVPIFVPGNEVHFYAVQPDLEQNIRMIFTKPFFPVAFESLGAKVFFHRLEPRKIKSLEGFNVTPYQLDHPDPCWGYKIQREGKTFSYCVDSETTRVSTKDMGLDLPLYQDVDLLIFDAQYTLVEASERVHWGHGAAPFGIDIAIREGVKKILFAHHDPAASDEKIFSAEEQTREYVNACLRNAKSQGLEIMPFQWEFAREGMVVKV